MHTDLLYSHLESFNDKSSYIEASAIISKDGLVMASVLPQGVDEDYIGALSAAMLSVSNHSSHEFIGCELEQITIKSARGHILMVRMGKEAMLTVITKPNARLDFVLLEMNRLAKSVALTLKSPVLYDLVAA